MARIFITGSADGLGQMAAKLLVSQGHSVVLHARNAQRAKDAQAAVKGADTTLIGDLASLAEMRSVAEQANKLGTFDAVIHNAAIGYQQPRRDATVDGFAGVFAINSLAPYVLTTLMQRPKRLVYLSSGLHQQGDASLRDLNWETRAWNGTQAYCDSKLHNTLLAFAMARLWPGTLSNAVEPGWVATKMGGRGASDDLQQGHLTQAWLAAAPDATETAEYWYHLKHRRPLPASRDEQVQDKLLAHYAGISGIPAPTPTGNA